MLIRVQNNMLPNTKKNWTILFTLTVLLFSGCYNTATSTSKNNTDLTTIVVNSILGVWDIEHANPVVVDEDSFGRRMYVFQAPTMAADDGINSLIRHFTTIMISQWFRTGTWETCCQRLNSNRDDKIQGGPKGNI